MVSPNFYECIRPYGSRTWREQTARPLMDSFRLSVEPVSLRFHRRLYGKGNTDGLVKFWDMTAFHIKLLKAEWQINPMCGLRGCKNWPAPFPGRMSYKATKPGLVYVLYLSMHYTVLLFIRAPYYVSLVFVAMCAVFWLFWLSYQYLPSDWLERLLWGSLIVARDRLQKV